MTDHALPDGWSIGIRPDGPLTVLTLRDADGGPPTTDYHGPTTGPARTVHSLDEINSETLRATAQRLINKNFHQAEQASATAAIAHGELPEGDTVTGRRIVLRAEGTITVHFNAADVRSAFKALEEIEYEDFDVDLRTRHGHLIGHITLADADSAELVSIDGIEADELSSDEKG